MKDGMKQQKLVEKMTIEEKAAILSGKTVWQTREIDRLSIPSIFLSDGFQKLLPGIPACVKQRRRKQCS